VAGSFDGAAIFKTGIKMECIRCGRCCRESIIHVSSDDLIREPRLAPHVNRFKHRIDVYLLETPCPFLREKKCSIYPTRPDECRDFQPGAQEMCSLFGLDPQVVKQVIEFHNLIFVPES